MAVDLNRVRRYERKYLVTEEQAADVRAFLEPFFHLDSFTDAAVGGYTVNNVYLDTPDLDFYHDVKLRRTRRFKTRMRYYGERPDDWLWLEVKNRDNEIVWKHRERVPVSAWPALLDAPVLSSDADAVRKVMGPRTFRDMVGLFPVTPVLHVRYFRQAWVSNYDDYGRVTFDRRLRCLPAYGSTDLLVPDLEMDYYDDAVTVNDLDSLVLVEIKTETLVPWWAIALTRRAELWQRGFSKYCYGIDRQRETVQWRRAAVIA